MTTKLTNFPLNFTENIVVTCKSTLALPWQPTFDSHVYQNLLFFV